MAMKLHTGRVKFDIEFDNGDKGYIMFNPNDPDLGTRLIASKELIEKRINDMKIEEVELTNSGDAVIPQIGDIGDCTPEQLDTMVSNAEKIAKIIESTKTIICEEINRAFDSDVSSVVFKHCSPFAIVNGQYFVVNFLEAIVPEIQKEIQKSQGAAEKRLGKHVNKYKK